jgi:gamma-glutamylcyclotransferase (GGCT)/AIG2-like uncharacterized protein YtfP
MVPDSDYLIVYGTLRQSFVNVFAQYLRQYSDYVGEGTFPGQLFDLGNYPGAVYQSESPNFVRGTVYDVSQSKDKLLPYLDEYEGISEGFQQPQEYVRAIIPVDCSGETHHCWVYLYNLPVSDQLVIHSGDYELYRKSI